MWLKPLQRSSTQQLETVVFARHASFRIGSVKEAMSTGQNVKAVFLHDESPMLSGRDGESALHLSHGLLQVT
jgi:hypothetical protein